MTARRSVAMLSLAVGVLVDVAAATAEEGGFVHATPPPFVIIATEPEAPPRLRLAWLDLAGVPTGVQSIARSEAASVLERMGLETAWRPARASEPAREGEIRVVVVDRLLLEPKTHRPILGATAATNRAVPVVWAHLASLRTTLRLSSRAPGGRLSLRETRDLGLALGRVVAHEAVHVLAPGLAHGRGLMARALSRTALTAPRISFEPGVAVVVRAALRGAPVETTTRAGILAASGAIGRLPEKADSTGIAATAIHEGDIHTDEGPHR